MTQSRNTSLRNTLPAICSAIAGQKGIKIVWAGPPRTDGSTIYSNPLPVDADEATVKIVVGDLDHESAHIRYSDFTAFQSAKATGLQKEIWNALEDTFIERRLGDDYLGCQQTLAESAEIAVAKGKCRTGENGPADAIVTFCDAWGRKNVLLQGIDPILTTSRAELVKHIEESGVERLEALLSTKLFSANSTDDTKRLSGAVIKLLKDIQEEQENPPPPPSQPQNGGDQGDDQNPSQGQDEGDAGGSSGDDDSDAGSNGDPSGSPDPSRGQGGDQPSRDGKGQPDANSNGGQSSQSGADSSPTPNTPDTGNGAGRDGSARQILEDDKIPQGPAINRREAAAEMTAQATAQGNFVFDPRSIQPPPAGENLSRYAELKAAVLGEIAQLQRRLAVEFQTARRVRSVTSEDGRLDGRRLTQALLGDPRVYRKKITSPVAKPAVSLVLDCSGSMGKDDIILAIQAVIAMAEVCTVMDAPFEVVTFGGANVGAIKTFEQPLARSRGRIGAIGAGGGTPTAEALWLAGNRLIARREERKLMLLVTDGDPNNMPAAQQVAGLIERSGIELYGIGIGAAAAKIRQVCRKAGLIENANDLAKAVLSALAERMLKAA